ncbi:MAG: glycosyltransferase family 2 protein [Dehalococcoidia bacterium]|nr:glycosyltransferase family 2 protein [Dehalococcoidia bacterium]
MSTPSVTAIVLNWCGEDVTRECLQSLLVADYPSLTILLIDNGSPDGSGERLHAAFPGVAYLQTGANLGYTGGNNAGIRWALEGGAEQVLVLNNDTVVEPAAVTHLVEAAAGGARVGAVVPKILHYAAPDRIWFGGGVMSRIRGLGLHERRGERDIPMADEPLRDVTFVTGCCCLFSADALRRVGGFAEDFFAYIEDVELSLRLSRAGYRLLYQPAARVLHRVPLHDGAAPTPFQILHRDRNRRRLVRRHYGWRDRLLFAAWFYPSRLVTLARYVGSGDWERAGALWRGMTEA